ncbi:hypothetical protein [Paraclostridium bifermentans]|uniref:AbiTii domain-containing protein n=1 Tax=Paraclostridium bifermentans TaxID=1490 RepID=UPI0025AFB710|nr:hypothetical protein [Paraclostridium bifermentans]
MSSLVLELQSKCIDPNITITDLLRHALVVSRKLKLTDFENWIKLELYGYKCPESELPDYRLVRGSILMCYNNQYFKTVEIEDKNLMDEIQSHKVNFSVCDLENYISCANDNQVIMPLCYDLDYLLREYIGQNNKCVLSSEIYRLKSILDYVKSLILEWSLTLESDGILGDDMTFSDNETKIAQNINYNINTFYKEVSNSQIQQNSDNCNQSI